MYGLINVYLRLYTLAVTTPLTHVHKLYEEMHIHIKTRIGDNEEMHC